MPNNIPLDEIELVQCLNELVKDHELKLALDTLRDVRSTFSKYDEYMEKIGQLIK